MKSNGDLLLSNDHDSLQIHTQDIHYIHINKPTGTENNIHHLKEESFRFQIVKNHENMALLTNYFDIIEQDDYEICILENHINFGIRY